jgi:hypothetical protein
MPSPGTITSSIVDIAIWRSDRLRVVVVHLSVIIIVLKQAILHAKLTLSWIDLGHRILQGDESAVSC